MRRVRRTDRKINFCLQWKIWARIQRIKTYPGSSIVHALVNIHKSGAKFEFSGRGKKICLCSRPKSWPEKFCPSAILKQFIYSTFEIKLWFNIKGATMIIAVLFSKSLSRSNIFPKICRSKASNKLTSVN